MTNVQTLSEQVELELVLSELWSAAEYLDAVDSGLTAPDAQHYQAMARRARRILQTYSVPAVQQVCRMSWALGELEENLRFERTSR